MTFIYVTPRLFRVNSSRLSISTHSTNDMGTLRLPLVQLLLLHVAMSCAGAVGEEHQQRRQFLYDCPETPLKDKAKNDITEYFAYHIESSVQEHRRGEKNDPSYYLDGFRNSRHGGHAEPYATLKEEAAAFRRDVFGAELSDGDVIYEGAGAEGMNLLMTLEILREESNITSLAAYGHDYLEPYVEIANKLFDAQVLTANGRWLKRGRYCQGDSTKLGFVPSNLFDLAYTYVDPLVDGLGRHRDEENYEVRVDAMKELCNSDAPDDQEVVKRDQELQEKWHSDWVRELIRITKPGKLIVVENVNGPVCDEISYWGGVAEEWWEKAATLYEWDVDIDSIKLHESWYYNAYHVSMRKKNDHGHVDDADDHEEGQGGDDDNDSYNSGRSEF